MKRKILALLLASVLILTVFGACNKVTPVLYVSAVLTTNSGSGLMMVTVKKDSSSGTAVQDATVKLNGNSLVHTGGGVYGASVSGVTNGLALTVSVDGAGSNVSCTANAPTAPGSVTKSIEDAVSGSSFIITCN